MFTRYRTAGLEDLVKSLLPISMWPLVVLAVLSPDGLVIRAADMPNTAYREIPQNRRLTDVDVPDFSDRMESGSLPALAKVGPGAFEFELQDRRTCGEQGSLMVWFYGQWKTIENQKALGASILLGLLDYLRATSR